MNSQNSAVEVYLKDMVEEYVDISMGRIFNSHKNGETFVSCKDKYISKEEIKSILQLLHPRYQDMGMNIIVHNSRWKTLIRYLNPMSNIDKNTLIWSWKGLYAGNQCRGNIDLIVYNRYRHSSRDKDKLKLFIVFDLIHEVRHVYQRLHMEKKYVKAHMNYIQGHESGYDSQWIERDANSFAQRMMNKHHEEINKILNIKGLSWYNIQHQWMYK